MLDCHGRTSDLIYPPHQVMLNCRLWSRFTTGWSDNPIMTRLRVPVPDVVTADWNMRLGRASVFAGSAF